MRLPPCKGNALRLPYRGSYLESEANGKLTYQELEFTLEHGGKTIYVYFVRLGEILSKKSK